MVSFYFSRSIFSLPVFITPHPHPRASPPDLDRRWSHRRANRPLQRIRRGGWPAGDALDLHFEAQMQVFAFLTAALTRCPAVALAVLRSPVADRVADTAAHGAPDPSVPVWCALMRPQLETQMYGCDKVTDNDDVTVGQRSFKS